MCISAQLEITSDMNLLIVSNMAHYFRDGQLVGHGTTALEISYLAQLFDEIRHIACLHPVEPPLSALPYRSDRIIYSS